MASHLRLVSIELVALWPGTGRHELGLWLPGGGIVIDLRLSDHARGGAPRSLCAPDSTRAVRLVAVPAVAMATRTCDMQHRHVGGRRLRCLRVAAQRAVRARRFASGCLRTHIRTRICRAFPSRFSL